MSKIRLEKATIDNSNYRAVINTTKQMQLVLMCLLIGEDIPEETHPNTTQFIRVEKGTAKVVVDGVAKRLSDGDSIVINAGSKHYVKQTGLDTLKLYTIYSPPEHPKGLVQIRQPIDKK